MSEMTLRKRQDLGLKGRASDRKEGELFGFPNGHIRVNTRELAGKRKSVLVFAALLPTLRTLELCEG